jgi:hypothetical protein
VTRSPAGEWRGTAWEVAAPHIQGSAKIELALRRAGDTLYAVAMDYVKPGVSEAQKKKDEAQCVQVALDTAGPRAAVPLAVDRDAVDRCMRERGYRVESST